MNAIYAPINVYLRGGWGGGEAGDLNSKHFFWSNALPQGHHTWLKHLSN